MYRPQSVHVCVHMCTITAVIHLLLLTDSRWKEKQLGTPWVQQPVTEGDAQCCQSDLHEIGCVL